MSKQLVRDFFAEHNKILTQRFNKWKHQHWKLAVGMQKVRPKKLF
jgi:hypothetical protein